MVTETEIRQIREKSHYLPNLQLLDAVNNQLKGDTLFGNWIKATYPDVHEMNNYKLTHFIPNEESYELSGFLMFFEDREELLRAKLKEAFPGSFEMLVTRYNLGSKLS